MVKHAKPFAHRRDFQILSPDREGMDHLQDEGKSSKPPPGLQALAEGEIVSVIDFNMDLFVHTATAADWFAAESPQ